MKVGDIYFADLSPCVGNEIGGIRPCKIIEIYYGDLVRIQPKVLNTIIMEYEFSEMHEKTISTKRLKEKISKKLLTNQSKCGIINIENKKEVI